MDDQQHRDWRSSFDQTSTAGLLGTLADVQAFLTQTEGWTAANAPDNFAHRSKLAQFRNQLLEHIAGIL